MSVQKLPVAKIGHMIHGDLKGKELLFKIVGDSKHTNTIYVLATIV